MADTKLDGVAAQVRALDPARVLARGFSITRDAAGAVVRDGAALVPGDRLTTELAAGRVASVVEFSDSGDTPHPGDSGDTPHPGEETDRG
jgi:exodeoxyribonuclease VII large subunit